MWDTAQAKDKMDVWLPAGTQPGGKSGGRALRPDCPVTALYHYY
jgi:hypothetical protein